MSVTSLDSRISPLSGRFSDSRITTADAFLVVAWTALTALFVAYAIAESSVGALLLAAAVLTQVWHAWSDVSSREVNDVRDQLAPQSL
jgi:hypothetical protein